MRYKYYILTTLVVHFVGALITAFCTWDIAYALPGSLMFALLGSPFLLVELPVVSIGLICLQKSSTKFLRITTSSLGFLISLIFPIRALTLGNLDSHELGISIAIPVGALIVLLVDHIRRQASKTDLPNKTLHPTSDRGSAS